jgi:hypothetical protein
MPCTFSAHFVQVENFYGSLPAPMKSDHLGGIFLLQGFCVSFCFVLNRLVHRMQGFCDCSVRVRSLSFPSPVHI